MRKQTAMILRTISAIICMPVVAIFNPRAFWSLYRTEIHRTEIRYSIKNKRLLSILLDRENAIHTYIDKHNIIQVYTDEVELNGLYGISSTNVEFLEIWFRSEEDKIIWKLKYPNKYYLNHALEELEQELKQ